MFRKIKLILSFTSATITKLSFVWMLFFSIQTWGIENITEQTAPEISRAKIKDSNEVKTLPRFPGGEVALKNFISNNLSYPKSSFANAVQGLILTQFIINEAGEVTNISIKRGLDTACNEEAIRVIKSMPRWIPGKQNGKNITALFTLPIQFKIMGPGNSSNKEASKNQNKAIQGKRKIINPTTIINSIPYEKVEQKPEFPGGEKQFSKFIQKNLRFPKPSSNNGIEGNVIVQFIINGDGVVRDVTIVRGLDTSCNEEALRVIGLSPKWAPGLQDGKVVPVSCIIPISFRIKR